MPMTFDFRREPGETAETFATRAQPGMDVLDSLQPKDIRHFYGGVTDKDVDGWQEITFTFECKTSP